MDKAELGRKGEAVAARYYQKNGFLLLDHNYKTRMGELDIILLKDDLLVIAEVKTRTSGAFSAPAEAVDVRKQQRLIRACGQYLQNHPFGDCRIRFDVVEVMPGPEGWRVHCIPDAFLL